MTRARAFFCLLVCTAMAAVACGDSKSDSEPNASTNSAQSTTTLQPQTGGSLSFAAFSEISGLDPIVALGHGTSGGIQMAAVYDTLMRYNSDTRKYENRMTESVVANADSTQWTIKLKSGIKFSDGTDFDADAVKFGLNRHRSGSAGAPACAEVVACPRNGTSSTAYMAYVKDITTVDKLTLSVTLTEPWTSFPYALAAEAGMIPSPTALRKCDPTKAARDCAFNLNAVGAGPFMVESFRPNESITLVRNPTYWNGPAYLDRLTFVTFGDSGGDKTYDAFKTGTVQGAYVRTPQSVDAAHQAKNQGFSTIEYAAEFEMMNMGVTVTCTGGKPEPLCVGKPDGAIPTKPVTANLKIRQAIAAAIDLNVINARAFDGKGMVSTDLFQKGFAWDPGVPGPKYDPDTAKRLVAEAKTAGWDGKLRLLFSDSPSLKEEGIALQTMLKAVGMDPELLTPPGTTYQTVVTSTKDFDLSTWGGSIGNDDSAIWSLSQNLDSKSGSNRTGFNSPAADKAFKDLRAAKTDEEKTAAYKVIAQEVNAQLPWVTKVAKETFSVFGSKVHGVAPGFRAYVFFDKAWIEK